MTCTNNRKSVTLIIPDVSFFHFFLLFFNVLLPLEIYTFIGYTNEFLSYLINSLIPIFLFLNFVITSE